MRVALLGAGHIGHTIAHLLSQSGDYQVTVMDRSAEALARLPPPINTLCIDTADGAALLGALQGKDVVINALPYHLATLAATQAVAAGCHYFDLTEDVNATRAIMKIAKGAKTALMPQCGLAPGFIGIVAHHLTKGFQLLKLPAQ
jgi:saccharopine dehydrogenase-like NADP-dependent oxidoreductase